MQHHHVLQAKLIEIFTDLSATFKNIPSRMKAESFKQRVVACVKAWEVSGAGVKTGQIYATDPVQLCS